MNRSGPAGLPQLGGDRTGSGSRVAGADVAFPGIDSANAGTGLVSGAGQPSPGAQCLAQPVVAGADSIHLVGSRPLGSAFNRPTGGSAFLTVRLSTELLSKCYGH